MGPLCCPQVSPCGRVSEDYHTNHCPRKLVPQLLTACQRECLTQKAHISSLQFSLLAACNKSMPSSGIQSE